MSERCGISGNDCALKDANSWLLFAWGRVLQRFTKPSHLFAKCLSLVVGDLVFGIVGLRCFLEDIEPFRTPRLGPDQGGMVAALLGKERSPRAVSFFLQASTSSA